MGTLNDSKIMVDCPECNTPLSSTISFQSPFKKRLYFRTYCYVCKLEFVAYKIRPNITILENYDLIDDNYLQLTLCYKK